MYVIGSYLVLLAMVLLLAALLFAGAVVVLAVREMSRIARKAAEATLVACAGLVTQWIPKPLSAFWPHHREQHSH